MISHVGRRAVAAANAAPQSGFAALKHAVGVKFQAMTAYPLFRAGVDKDALWETYLEAWPAGSNEVFRVRREHDCSCCRSFVRTIGDLVAVDADGALITLWDIRTEDAAHRAVCDRMAVLVRSKPIDNLFLHTERHVGTDRSFERKDGDEVRTWEHFHVELPHRNEGSLVCRGVDIGPRLSASRADHDVLLRSLTELTPEAVETVLDLIGRNALYRGEEHRHAVERFHAIQRQFSGIPEARRDAITWRWSIELSPSVRRIRNTAIGTLLDDLSSRTPLERAVASFEAKVAPANYKRTTALVTKAMVEKARKELDGLGLTTALERRYATLADVSVNNVLFADRSARKAMKAGGVFDEIGAQAAVKPQAFDRTEEVGIDAFLADVLPGASSLEVLVENRHAGNFVSLIAPADPGAGRLFKWDNGFSWSYAGDVADSIRERVKRAGGNVTGELCCRLAWSNYDDLDLHMVEPNRYEIYFGNRGQISPSGGYLDVDANAGGRVTREPVENIFYPAVALMNQGTYRLFVRQFAQREGKDVGFEAEIDFLGDVRRFAYPKALRTGERVEIATFRLHRTRAGVEIEYLQALPESSASKKVWNVDTQAFHRVNVAMLSPNHWDGQGVGNRHFFFFLDGCRNDGSARGFYNEFLRSDLDPHRKVFEMVGARMRAEESPDQLSGLGFSTTQRNHVVARVSGSRTLKIIF